MSGSYGSNVTPVGSFEAVFLYVFRNAKQFCHHTFRVSSYNFKALLFNGYIGIDISIEYFQLYFDASGNVSILQMKTSSVQHLPLEGGAQLL